MEGQQSRFFIPRLQTHKFKKHGSFDRVEVEKKVEINVCSHKERRPFASPLSKKEPKSSCIPDSGRSIWVRGQVTSCGVRGLGVLLQQRSAAPKHLPSFI